MVQSEDWNKFKAALVAIPPPITEQDIDDAARRFGIEPLSNSDESEGTMIRISGPPRRR